MGGGSLQACMRSLWWASVVHSAAGASSLRPTPLLVSPLEGGRDELGSADIGALLRAPHSNPSPLLGGRLGGGWDVSSTHQVVVPGADCTLDRRRRHGAPTPFLVSPLEGGRDEFSWGGCRCVGARFPNSSLPPFRGEVRWGVGSHERASGRCAGHRSHARPPAQARCADPPLSLPLEGGRDELGGRVGVRLA